MMVGMKTPEQLGQTLAAVHCALPRAIDPVRVKSSVERATRGMLRVTLDGNLVGEWGYGVCGWMQCESSAWLGYEGQKVYSAIVRTLRAET